MNAAVAAAGPGQLSQPGSPDARPVHDGLARPATLAESATWMGRPDTSEAAIAAYGIPTSAHLAVVLARAPKGPDLLAAVIDAVVGGVLTGPGQDGVLADLLAEPAITAAHLISLARARPPAGFNIEALMVALCAHALAPPAMVVDVLWNAPTSTQADVAAATGCLLAPAVSWVRRSFRVSKTPGWARWLPSVSQRAEIVAVAERWAAATHGQPDMVAFLLTSSLAFTDEDTMFAAGRALTAAPAGPPAP